MKIFDECMRIARSVPALTVVALVAVSLSGCEGLLDIEDPENVTGEGIEEASPDLLVNRAYADLQVAYSGGGLDDKILSVSALMSDQFFSSGTFTTRTATDQRDQFPSSQGNTSDAAFGDLHDARIAARNAADRLEAEQGADDPRIPVMNAFEGYTMVALSENYCSNIPLSTPTEEFAPGEAGEPLSTSELFNRAVDTFDQALAVAPPGSDAAHLAAVGKGRALLSLGEFQAAADAVADVPTEFVWFIEHSDNTTSQENPIFNLQLNGRYSVSNGEGEGLGTIGNGVAYHHKDGDPANEEQVGEDDEGNPIMAPIGDPRVPWVQDPDGGFDGATPLYIDLRYPSRNADVVLADGIEARLIEAEAQIQADAFGQAEQTLNDLRAEVTALMDARYDDPFQHPTAAAVGEVKGFGETLDALTLPADQAAATDVLFRERAFWLFDTGHRLGDLRRLARAPYDRNPDDIYPAGAYHKGGQYGNDVNFWIPFDEVNNPNFNIEMCDVTAP